MSFLPLSSQKVSLPNILKIARRLLLWLHPRPSRHVLVSLAH